MDLLDLLDYGARQFITTKYIEIRNTMDLLDYGTRDTDKWDKWDTGTNGTRQLIAHHHEVYGSKEVYGFTRQWDMGHFNAGQVI